MLISLPTDIKYQIFKMQTYSQEFEMVSLVPELYQFDKKFQQAVVVIIKHKKAPLPKKLQNRYGKIGDYLFIITVPSKFSDPELLSKFTRNIVSSVQKSLEAYLPAIKTTS
ncbi:hypothetical protein WICPIJ_003139, partial [Wickerhamomyces pijperi]